MVVDDLSLSFESVVRARRALHTFIDTQLGSDDLAAILRTSAGIGSLQQFTTNRRLLHAAAVRVQWTVFGRNAAFDAVAPDLRLDSAGAPAPGGRASRSRGDSRIRDEEDTLEGLRSSMVTVGSLGALEFAVRGLASLPGRKSIILVSDGFDPFRRRADPRIWDALRRVVDSANRAGVAISAIDARGLQTGGATAEAEHPSAGSGSLTGLLHSQDGLRWLAEQTGGIAVVNNNHLTRGFERILADQTGYYLVGYDAHQGTDSFKPDRIRVQVRRPGLRVRWRRGTFGPASGSSGPVAEPDTLQAAILSPFAAAGLTVRLTSLFGYSRNSGSYVHSMLFLDAQDLALRRDPAGTFSGKLEILVIAVGDGGQLATRWQRDVPLQLSEAEYDRVRERGLLYSATLPMRDPGGYQIRAAVRDADSGPVGSASQFVTVPRVKSGSIALSGVLMKGMPARDGDGILTPGDAAVPESLLQEPPIRIFRPGSEVVYACEIYSGATGRDRLFMSASLLRDGRAVYQSPVSQVRYSRSREEIWTVPERRTLPRATDDSHVF